MSDKTVDNSVIFESVMADIRLALGSDDCELNDAGIALLWASKRITTLEQRITQLTDTLEFHGIPVPSDAARTGQ